jgi:ribosome modulation factor
VRTKWHNEDKEAYAAYLEGYAAKLQNKTKDECPYPPDPEPLNRREITLAQILNDRWQEGWQDGHEVPWGEVER